MRNQSAGLLAAALVLAAIAAPAMARKVLQGAQPLEVESVAAPDDGGKRAVMLGFVVRPQSFSMSHNVQFDDQGKIQHENHSAQLQFTISYGGDVKPVSYETIEVTKLTGGDGAALPLPQPTRNSQPINDNDQNRRFGISVALPDLPPSIESIGLLEANITIQCGLGEQRHARLGKAADIEGRRIKVEGLDQELSFVIRRENQNKRVRLETPRSASAYIAHVTFTDAAGNVIPSRGGGFSYDGNQVTRYYYLEWPDEGTATASFYTAIEAVRVPITVRDLPLRKPMQKRDHTEVVVQAVPADQLKAAGTAPAQPPAVQNGEQLRVLID